MLLIDVEINVLRVGFSGTNIKEARGNVCDEDFCILTLSHVVVTVDHKITVFWFYRMNTTDVVK